MNFKSVVEKYKNKMLGAAVMVSTLLMPVIAHAETPPALDIAGPMTTAMNTTVTTTLSCFSAVIPIGLTIFAAKFAWTKGVKFFSSIAKQS